MKKRLTLWIAMLVIASSSFAQPEPVSAIWKYNSGNMNTSVQFLFASESDADFYFDGGGECSTPSICNNATTVTITYAISGGGMQTTTNFFDATGNSRLSFTGLTPPSPPPANNELFSGTVAMTYDTGTGSQTIDFVFEGGVLPVSLSSFSAKKMTNSVMLEWQTDLEINNDYFGVEHSINGNEFEVIARVKSNSNSSDVNNYSAEDKDPSNGINYYRLRKVDYNGEESFSKTVKVKFNNGPSTLKLSPTLVKNEVIIDLSDYEGRKSSIEITNANGQSVLSKNEINSNFFTLNVRDLNLSKGLYFIRTHNNNQMAVGKFIVIE